MEEVAVYAYKKTYHSNNKEYFSITKDETISPTYIRYSFKSKNVATKMTKNEALVLTDLAKQFSGQKKSLKLDQKQIHDALNTEIHYFYTISYTPVRETYLLDLSVFKLQPQTYIEESIENDSESVLAIANNFKPVRGKYHVYNLEKNKKDFWRTTRQYIHYIELPKKAITETIQLMPLASDSEAIIIHLIFKPDFYQGKAVDLKKRQSTIHCHKGINSHPFEYQFQKERYSKSLFSKK